MDDEFEATLNKEKFALHAYYHSKTKMSASQYVEKNKARFEQQALWLLEKYRDIKPKLQEQARADERAKCLKGSFYRRTGTFYCEGCSFKCQASDCECICHKPLVQIAFNRGIKKGLSSAEESFAKRLKEAEKKAFSEGQADAFDVLIRRISSWGIELNPKDKKGIKMLNDVLDIIDEEASESLLRKKED